MIQRVQNKQRFKLGQTVITRGADATITEIAAAKQNIKLVDGKAQAREAFRLTKQINQIKIQLIKDHQNLEQGVLDSSDYQQNIEACAHEGEKDDKGCLMQSRIFSAFNIDNIKFWVITEWDRSVTTILLPDEY
jgi:hypothetical protein